MPVDQEGPNSLHWSHKRGNRDQHSQLSDAFQTQYSGAPVPSTPIQWRGGKEHQEVPGFSRDQSPSHPFFGLSHQEEGLWACGASEHSGWGAGSPGLTTLSFRVARPDGFKHHPWTDDTHFFLQPSRSLCTGPVYWSCHSEVGKVSYGGEALTLGSSLSFLLRVKLNTTDKPKLLTEVSFPKPSSHQMSCSWACGMNCYRISTLQSLTVKNASPTRV